MGNDRPVIRVLGFPSGDDVSCSGCDKLVKFVPEKWQPRPKDIHWAIENFRINDGEVKRQIELMRDHEFKRSYTDWNRVFRNWMRKAEDINTLHRDRSYTQPDQITAEEREQDNIKAWAELNKLKAMRDRDV